MALVVRRHQRLSIANFGAANYRRGDGLRLHRGDHAPHQRWVIASDEMAQDVRIKQISNHDLRRLDGAGAASSANGSRDSPIVRGGTKSSFDGFSAINRNNSSILRLR